MKLTASKMSRAALAAVDSGKRIPRERRGDVGSLVGSLVGALVSTLVGGALVGFGGVGVGRVGVGRVGVGRVGVAGKSTGSCKSGKGESRDDFELHIVLLLS